MSIESTEDDLLRLKERSIKTCQALLDERIHEANTQLAELQDAASNETKSSMGDKYETGRAMVQLEKDKLATQIATHQKLQKVMQQVRPGILKQPALGALIDTDKGYFFISVGIGMIEIPEKVICLSPVSPLGRLFTQSGVGDSITFNKMTYEIRACV